MCNKACLASTLHYIAQRITHVQQRLALTLNYTCATKSGLYIKLHMCNKAWPLHSAHSLQIPPPFLHKVANTSRSQKFPLYHFLLL